MNRVADSNIPNTPSRWSVAAAGREFDFAQATLERKIRDAGETPDAGGAYTTKAIARAIYGSLFAERLRRVTEEADRVALANAVSRGELLPRGEPARTFAEVVDAIVCVIRNSGLSRFDQEQIQKNLASIPLIIEDAARRQDKRRGTDGARG